MLFCAGADAELEVAIFDMRASLAHRVALDQEKSLTLSLLFRSASRGGKREFMAQAKPESRTYVVVGHGRVAKMLIQSLPTSATVVQTRGRSAVGRRDAWVGTRRDRLCVLLAVPDRAIEDVAARYTECLEKGDFVFHLSGLGGLATLDAARRKGAHVGVLHPLLAIYQHSASKPLSPSFAVDGDKAARTEALRIGKLLGWKALAGVRPSAIYHAAAVTVAAGIYALVSRATDMLVSAGAKRKDAERALVYLAASALRNAEQFGTPRALTGPMVRGDVRTIREHRNALVDSPAAQKQAYQAAVTMAQALVREMARPAKK